LYHATKSNNIGSIGFDLPINRTTAMVDFLNKTVSWYQKVHRRHYKYLQLSAEFKLFIFDNHSLYHAVKFNNNGIVSFDFLINRATATATIDFLNKTVSWYQKVHRRHHKY